MINRNAKITRTCPFCGRHHIVWVANIDYASWQGGTLAQHAFPYLNSTEREQLISGMCPQCQANVFGEEDDLFEDDESWLAIDVLI